MRLLNWVLYVIEPNFDLDLKITDARKLLDVPTAHCSGWQWRYPLDLHCSKDQIWRCSANTRRWASARSGLVLDGPDLRWMNFLPLLRRNLPQRCQLSPHRASLARPSKNELVTGQAHGDWVPQVGWCGFHALGIWWSSDSLAAWTCPFPDLAGAYERVAFLFVRDCARASC